MNRAVDWVLDLLYPPKCVFCRRLLSREETEICRSCRLSLPVAGGSREFGAYLSGGVAALYYEGAVRESLLRYKFGSMEQYAACYGRLLAAACTALPLDTVDLVTWVPVSRKRRRRRGYDQAGLLARARSAELDKPLASALMKTRDNPAQSLQGSPEARRANVLGVYQARAQTALAGKVVLLVDDIVTTGATASEAARVLLTAGAAGVYLAVLAIRRAGESNGLG